MTKKADSSDGSSRLARVVKWAGLGLLVVALAVIVVGWLVLRASLPRTDGTVEVRGLSAEVQVSRDSLGIPVIRAEYLEDAIRAQGVLHAQDRFFQMDLMRRSGGGELAGLLGSRLLAADRSRRRRGYSRTRARRFLAELSDRGRRFIAAYTEGVNVGLQDLGARPPEYLLLRTEPERWRPEDCVLTWMAVSSTLSVDPDENDGDVLRATLPPELVDFLRPEVTRFDVPMIVSEELPAGGYRPATVPGPDVIDLRDRDSVPRWEEPVVAFPPAVGGSNAWAVSGDLTAGDGALQMRLLGPLLAPAREADPDFVFRYRGKAWESVLRILEERPPHLLPPGQKTWRTFLRAVLRDLAVELQQASGSGGIDASWGEVKQVHYRHPLGGVPLIGSWLDMDPFPSSGNPMTVQNRSPPVGQLLRLVVNPARIDRGRFHMPVGQSGHVLSPHYDDFHQSWAVREMRPLAAGPAESSFTLAPNE